MGPDSARLFCCIGRHCLQGGCSVAVERSVQRCCTDQHCLQGRCSVVASISTASKVGATLLHRSAPPARRDPVQSTNMPDSFYKPSPMSWKHTPAMAGEKCVVDKRQGTAGVCAWCACVCARARAHGTRKEEGRAGDEVQQWSSFEVREGKFCFNVNHGAVRCP
eukprot:1160442-Pelagomonas_calceolata.AAC.12